ncbi:MAG TPA: hypothetical protein ENI51_03310 [Candidatus Atribacteria bacterium]|nr:hypothetical protein [Candidatus Atribacteria bacterium]
MKLPLIIGHRGAKGIAPENSLSGFKKAVELGADGVELDVHLSKDNQLVVFHDMGLKRLTGQKILIKQLAFRELKKYDISEFFGREQEKLLKKLPEEKVYFIELRAIQNNAFYLNIFEQISKREISFYLHWDGKQFDRVKKLFLPRRTEGEKIGFKQLRIKKKDILDLKGEVIRSYHNERIPLLREVLNVLRGRVFANIEIKGGERIYPGIIDKLVKETENFGYNNILFSCFERDTAILLKERYPHLKVNLLFDKPIIPKSYINRLDGLNLHYFFGGERLVSYLHNKGKTIYVWTVNKDIDMLRLILYGVDGIITNYPYVLKKVSKAIKSILSDFY